MTDTPANRDRGRPLRVGTRGSPLALVQTRDFMRRAAEALPDHRTIEEAVIATTGDVVQDRRLADIGGKGLFAKEIHEALLDRRIDCAVHSLKDLETELPAGIVLACVLPREDPRDVVLTRLASEPRGADPFAVLARGALVGTSSVRRQAQLLHARPDLRVESIRGNIQTRLAKLQAGVCDASLLALAGLNRMRLDPPNAIVLSISEMVPAAAQGIVGITARAYDTEVLGLLSRIEDRGARVAAMAERSLLAELDGSCRTPIGAFAELSDDGTLTLTGLVARADGSYLVRRTLTGPAADAERLGQTLGISLRADAPQDLFD